jgi:hypothetical protein
LLLAEIRQVRGSFEPKVAPLIGSSNENRLRRKQEAIEAGGWFGLVGKNECPRL